MQETHNTWHSVNQTLFDKIDKQSRRALNIVYMYAYQVEQQTFNMCICEYENPLVRSRMEFSLWSFAVWNSNTFGSCCQSKLLEEIFARSFWNYWQAIDGFGISWSHGWNCDWVALHNEHEQCGKCQKFPLAQHKNNNRQIPMCALLNLIDGNVV